MSTPMHMTNCPSEETLAAFIDGRLDIEARQRVVEHVTTCEDCYAIVSFAWDFQAEEPAEAGEGGRGAVARGGGRVVRGRFGGRVWWAGAAAAAAVVTVFLPPIHNRLFSGPSTIVRLVDASEHLEKRPVEGRLSGGFSYKKFDRPKRGGGDQSGDLASADNDIAHLNLSNVGADVESEAKKHPSPQNLAAAATSSLLLRQITQAVDNYTQALIQETGTTAVDVAVGQSKNADLLNDLAVAYSDRALTGNDSTDHVRALNAIERAHQLKTDDLMILWNRALILERAGHRQQAFQEWQRYLELDATSPWATEAREHLSGLQEAMRLDNLNAVKESLKAALSRNELARAASLVIQHAEQLRVDCEEELLADIGTGGYNAQLVAFIARTLAEEERDPLLLDSLNALKSADTAATRAAFNAYRLGCRAHKDGQYKDAIPHFRDARRRMEDIASPFSIRAAWNEARMLLYDGQNPAAISLINQELGRNQDAARLYPLVAGQLYWIRGLASHGLGNPSIALRNYEKSLPLIEGIGEPGSLAGIELVTADAYRAMGETREAWRHHFRAVRLLNASIDLERQHNVLNGVVRAATREGYSFAAALIHDGVLAVAEQGSKPLFVADAWLTRSQFMLSNADFPGAKLCMTHATAAMSLVSDSGARTRLAADIDVAGYRIDEAQGVISIDALTKSLDLLHGIDNRSRLAELYLLRSRAFSVRKQVASARADIDAGLREIDAQRTPMRSDERRTFATVAASLVDEGIRLDLDAGNDESAFDLAERERARVLVEEFSKARNEPLPARLPVKEIAANLPERTAVIAQSLNANQLITWVIQHSGLRTYRAPISAAKLTNDAQELITLVATDSALAAIRRRADALRAVVLPDGINADRLIIAPDAELYGIPWTVLYNAKARKYVIQQYEITIVPSLAFCWDHAGPQDRGLRAALIVDASQSREDHILPSARAEADVVASVFPQPHLLRNGRGTREQFRRSIVAADVFHYAGHAVANVMRPERSRLLMGADDSEGVTAEEIAKLPLSGLSLVVLAACRTSSGNTNSDVLLTLSTAFISAGVPTVIATWADADDASTAELFASFYGLLRSGVPAAAALRQSQLRLLESRQFSAPGYWAPFIVMGYSRA